MKSIKYIVMMLVFMSCAVYKPQKEDEYLVAMVITPPKMGVDGSYYFKVIPYGKYIMGTDGKCYWLSIPHDTLTTHMGTRGRNYKVGGMYTFSY